MPSPADEAIHDPETAAALARLDAQRRSLFAIDRRIAALRKTHEIARDLSNERRALRACLHLLRGEPLPELLRDPESPPAELKPRRARATRPRQTALPTPVPASDPVPAHAPAFAPTPEPAADSTEHTAASHHRTPPLTVALAPTPQPQPLRAERAAIDRQPQTHSARPRARSTSHHHARAHAPRRHHQLRIRAPTQHHSPARPLPHRSQHETSRPPEVAPFSPAPSSLPFLRVPSPVAPPRLPRRVRPLSDTPTA